MATILVDLGNRIFDVLMYFSYIFEFVHSFWFFPQKSDGYVPRDHYGNSLMCNHAHKMELTQITQPERNK